MDFKIDRNVPIPPKSGAGAKKYHFEKMEIGDSTFIVGKTMNVFGGTLAHYRPLKFSARTVTENGVKGVRVWRVE